MFEWLVAIEQICLRLILIGFVFFVYCILHCLTDIRYLLRRQESRRLKGSWAERDIEELAKLKRRGVIK